MSSPVKRLLLVFVGLAVLIFCFLLYSYNRWRDDISGGATAATSMASIPECHHENKMVKTQGVAGVTTTLTTLSVSGAITNVPEFHDCQRFVVGDSDYGPLVAIYVSYKLDSLVDSIARLDSTKTYVAETTTNAVGVSEIYDYDGDYAPLGIRHGFNCLMLYKKNHAYEAKIWPVDDEKKCVTTGFDPTRADLIPLQVKPWGGVITTPPGTQTYPPVARWDWDSDHKQQYIGLRCRTQWCEIGAAGFASSARDLPDGGTTSGGPTEMTVRRVKGWYDEQFLDVPASAGGSAFRWTRVTAKVFPHPAMKTYTMATYYNATTGHSNGWVATGFVSMGSAIPHYKSKFNFDGTAAGAELKDMNKLHMCYGTKGDCGINALAYTRCGYMNWLWSIFYPRWWAQITPAGGGPVMQKCVIRREHPGVTMGVPGTARWRWLATDPTTWEECLSGCCEVQTCFTDCGS